MGFHRAARESERGQSLVEMSVGLVILSMIVMGILDLGRVYFLYLALQDAAGEAALYLSIHPGCPIDPNPTTDGDVCDNPENALYRAKHSSSGYIGWSDVDNATLFGYEVTDFDQGTPVKVTLTYPYQVLTPLISAIVRNAPINLTTSASGVIIVDPDSGS